MSKKKKNLIWAGVCAAVYIVVLWRIVPFVYGIIDDRSMMEIVSGQYLGYSDAHTIFMGYWYSLLLAGLYRFVPNMDWYALSYIFLQGICISLMIYQLLAGQRDTRNKVLSIALVLLLFTFLGVQAMTQLTFTTTAAILGITVIFWYMTTKNLELFDWVLLFVLCFLTEQIRSSVFFMILPVCGILWLFRVLTPEGKEKWHLMVPVAVLGVFVLSAAGKQFGYGNEAWNAYEKYNMNRSEVYDYSDYTLPPYDGAESFYNSIGIEKKSRARTLINYNYTADDRITPEFFENYIAAYENAFPSLQSKLAKVRQSTKDYLKYVISGKFHMQHMLAFILYVLLTVWYFVRKKWIFCWKVLCVAGIQVLLWIYLIYEGRIPERVIYSMNLMLVVTAILLCAEALKDMEIFSDTNIPVSFAICILLSILAVSKIREIRQQNLEMSHRNEDVESLKEYCMEHPKNFYFNDVTSMAFTTYNVHLWQQEPYVMNYMSLGDWMSYSPVWQKKLEQKGIFSVKEALYGSENVYLICSFDKGLEYLVSLYEDITCTEIDKIPGFKIYQLQFL